MVYALVFAHPAASLDRRGSRAGCLPPAWPMPASISPIAALRSLVADLARIVADISTEK